jgi:SpoVK/Ycf46/Vps4 family AAA+-type ATPase
MGFKKSIKPGYRALFFGPPGTGKTLTASLLGKSMNMDVYRIELSSVVSKYIGETEKNLETIFQQAENRQWILFFDEADALFGKRSDTQSSNDRHANQEVAYLLQRIEEFPGVVILATNLKSNIDDAFLRRFQSMIFFPVPDPLQRQILWEKALNKSEYVASEVDVKELSKSYELAGGSIINVIRYAAIASLRNGSQLITQKDLLAGVAKEQRKQGRII